MPCSRDSYVQIDIYYVFRSFPRLILSQNKHQTGVILTLFPLTFQDYSKSPQEPFSLRTANNYCTSFGVKTFYRNMCRQSNSSGYSCHKYHMGKAKPFSTILLVFWNGEECLHIQCRIIIYPHFQGHIMDVHKLNIICVYPWGCTVHHLACPISHQSCID